MLSYLCQYVCDLFGNKDFNSVLWTNRDLNLQFQIQLTPSQLQMIRMQMQGGTNQPIIIQTAPIQAIQQPVTQPQIIQVLCSYENFPYKIYR
jgi:hypothetical protein